MTVELVILNNPNNQVVEMWAGREITLKKGDNVVPKQIATFLLGKKKRGYKILGPANQGKSVCPYCGQIIEAQSAPVQEPTESPQQETKPTKSVKQEVKKVS